MPTCTDSFIIRFVGATSPCSITIATIDRTKPSATTSYGHGTHGVTVDFAYTKGTDGNDDDSDNIHFRWDVPDFPTGVSLRSHQFTPRTPDLSGAPSEVQQGSLYFDFQVADTYTDTTVQQRTIEIRFSNGTPSS